MEAHAPFRLAFLIITCATAIGIAGTDLVLPAIPSLPAALGSTAEQAQFVLAAFTGGAATGLLLFGELGARIDQRRLLLGSLTVYGLASLTCALSTSLSMLMVLRFMQGVRGEGAVFLGAGIRYSGALAYNPKSGDVFLKGSFGGGVGVGGAGGAGLSAQSSPAQAGVRGSLDARLAGGIGYLGGDVKYNYQTIENGKRLGSQGASGSGGLAKGYGGGLYFSAGGLCRSWKKVRKLGNDLLRWLAKYIDRW